MPAQVIRYTINVKDRKHHSYYQKDYLQKYKYSDS